MNSQTMDVFVQCRVTSDPNVPSLQSNEKGDVLNPLITGVFLEVCVTPHMHKHTHTHNGQFHRWEHFGTILNFVSSSFLAGVQQRVLRPGCFPAAVAHTGDRPHPEEGPIHGAVTG